MQDRSTIEVSVELPVDTLGTTPPDSAALGAELRVLWAVEQVRQRRLGVGRAAEVAAMPRAAFMLLLGEHGVPAIDYPVADLKREIETLRNP